ncbi:MAG: glycosyltransferase family 39 protein [Caulobacteraceae bacterium]
MTQTVPRPRPGSRAMDPAALALTAVSALTCVRLIVLFVTPLQLYPDEAQYWSWSRHLAFGYFSKPPMIAWLIASTTAIGGDAEPWVRLSAPLLHAAAALVLGQVGRRLYGPWAGFWAAIIYSLMPGVQLSATVIATDAPMLLFVSLALWAYVGLLSAQTRRGSLACAAGVGLAVGLGCLAKYAALYFVVGLILHAAVDRDARGRWKAGEIILAIGLLLACIAPNFIWNLGHSFQTVTHTVSNLGHVGGGSGDKFDPRRAPGFLVSQFGVFGPVAFGVLVVGAAVLVRRRALTPDDRMLLLLAAPPILIVLVEAMLVRANANWAGAAYSPASVLVAGWLVRWRATRTLGALAAVHGMVAALFVLAMAAPTIADRAGLSNSLKRARGWRQATDAVLARVDAERARGPVSAIAVDDRFLFNALAYYGRDRIHAPGEPPLRIWVREAKPNNQAETTAPLTPAEGGRVVFAQAVGDYHAQTVADFAAAEDEQRVKVRLDSRHTRDLTLFVGSGFNPKPRVRGAPSAN